MVKAYFVDQRDNWMDGRTNAFLVDLQRESPFVPHLGVGGGVEVKAPIPDPPLYILSRHHIHITLLLHYSITGKYIL